MNSLDHYDEGFLDSDAYFDDNDAANTLYDNFASSAPIVDAHTHADDAKIAADTAYENAWEIAGEGDHYVYCAMRQAGVDERMITGNGHPKDKFRELCCTMETVGSNPLSFWIHNGLKTSLEVDAVMRGISRFNANELWDEINERLQDPQCSPRGLIKNQGVVFLGTTDDPTSTLENHKKIKQDGFEVEIVPTFRPDALVKVLGTESDLKKYIDKLATVSDTEICDLEDLENALSQRHGAFVDMGCRASDHGPDQMPRKGYGEKTRTKYIFEKALGGEEISEEEKEIFTGWLIGLTAELNTNCNMVTQLHAGGWRNLNSKMNILHGPDIGFDGSRPDLDLHGHQAFLDWADSEGLFARGLKVIPYPMNTKDQETMASFARMFAPGVKLGSSWWFIDTAKGMEDQFAIAEGIVSLPVSHAGMVSDTRSPITTASRFDLSRQALCKHTGEQLEMGRMRSAQAISQVKRIAEGNAREIFNVPGE